MALIERLRKREKPVEPSAEAPEPVEMRVEAPDDSEYQALKSDVHNKLLEYLDLSRLSMASEEQVQADLERLVTGILDESNVPLTSEQRRKLIREVGHEVFGLGPLEPLLQDPSISDILVNRHDRIYIERRGRIERTKARFKDAGHLMRIIEKIVSAVGRRVDESTPLVDARLADGSRVNVIVPPLALDGPCLSIRRFAVDPLQTEDLVANGTLTAELVPLLRGIVVARLNAVISGGTGSGKTTLLNVLSGYVPEEERIITVEDSAELQLQQAHVVRLETRPPNIEGRGRISQRDLVINSLRMRPDRIIVGEVRGGEAVDMLQAMNTGHDGSLTTIHSNSPRDALARIETMVAMSGIDMPERSIREQVASAIHVIIQLSRLSDGSRRLVSLQEVTGMEGSVVTTQEIFAFERHGVEDDGTIRGELLPTGIRPRFAEKLKLVGIELPWDLFRRKAA